TGGNRASFSSQFAGGPLGGAFDYNKTRLESRWYFPSFLRHVTTMVRFKLGALNAYSSHDSIPVYERFRLGGTTLDGLRGYEDYEVVPRANEHFVAAFRKDANGNFVPIADDSSGRVYLPVPEDTP